MADAALHAEFDRYCAFGAGQSGSAEIDSAKFSKLCKECGLVDKKCRCAITRTAGREPLSSMQLCSWGPPSLHLGCLICRARTPTLFHRAIHT
jgi:p25-alpha